MERDPVCGMIIDDSTAAAKTRYKEITYYFCAPGCFRAFLNEPEKYLNRQEANVGTGSNTAFKNKQ